MFEFREFLRQNPSHDNLAFVFPPEEDIDVTPEMVTAVSVVAMMSDSIDVFHEETFDFFQLFLHELHDGKIGNMCTIRGIAVNLLNEYQFGK